MVGLLMLLAAGFPGYTHTADVFVVKRIAAAAFTPGIHTAPEFSSAENRERFGNVAYPVLV